MALGEPGSEAASSAVLSDDELAAKVAAALERSALLESWWRAALKGEDLQAEIDRMVRDTKSPTVLREIFAALGDDPFLVAEVLARPIVAERRVAELYAADDRIHGGQRAALEARLAGLSRWEDFQGLDGIHLQLDYVLDEKAVDEPDERSGAKTIVLDTASFQAKLAGIARLDEGAAPGDVRGEGLALSDLGDRFEVEALREETPWRLSVEVVVWPKRAYEDWARDSAPPASFGAMALLPPEGGYRLGAALAFSQELRRQRRLYHRKLPSQPRLSIHLRRTSFVRPRSHHEHRVRRRQDHSALGPHDGRVGGGPRRRPGPG